jgi:hypothetical protein
MYIPNFSAHIIDLVVEEGEQIPAEERTMIEETVTETAVSETKTAEPSTTPGFELLLTILVLALILLIRFKKP